MASNRKMLQALLKGNGAHKVDTAENGLEAVHAAKANKYDIIFMDNFMPIMVPCDSFSLVINKRSFKKTIYTHMH